MMLIADMMTAAVVGIGLGVILAAASVPKHWSVMVRMSMAAMRVDMRVTMVRFRVMVADSRTATA